MSKTMRKINIGYTNEKYQDGNKFIVIKKQNEFNHKINYKLLSQFDFVPKLIKETKEQIIWEYIEGTMLLKPSNDDLKQLGKMMREIHKSDLQFPKNNLRKRIKIYIDIINDKTISAPEINNNYKNVNKILSNMNKLNPCHNDIWGENIIKDKNGKLWIVDWEYATMGDKHFDIAYFIESGFLNKDQQKIFLKEYNSYDNYWAYIPELLDKYKTFVNYITLCWALSQKKMPFPLEKIKEKLQENK